MSIWSSWGRRLVALPGVDAFVTFIGLGTAAFKNTGTSGDAVPLLNQANTWSAIQRFQAGETWIGADAGGSTLTANTSKDGRIYIAGYTNNLAVSVLISQAQSGSYTTFYGGASDGAYAMTLHRFYTAASINTLTGTERFQINGAGLVSTVTACFGRGAPVTKTADFTVAVNENWLINNKSGSACVVTLPAASSFTGREIMVKNHQAQQVNSASSNVVPLAGGAAGTAILTANTGRWATLVSDGTNWQIMAGVV